MAQEATQEEVLEAARSLGGELTRKDVADKLGVEVSAMQPSWKAAKQADRLEKIRDEGGERYFRLIDHSHPAWCPPGFSPARDRGPALDEKR